MLYNRLDVESFMTIISDETNDDVSCNTITAATVTNCPCHT